MYGLTDSTIEKFKDLFRTFPEISEVILYGSRARGDNSNGSDIDLTFVGENLNTDTLFRISNEIDDLYLPYYVDVSIMKNIKNEALLKNIKAEGKVIYVR